MDKQLVSSEYRIWRENGGSANNNNILCIEMSECNVIQ